IVAHPLEVADPDDGLGEFRGVGVDLDAAELGGGDAGEEAQGDLGGGGEGDDFLLAVEELLDGDVEEVARAAGGVEDGDGGEAVDEVEDLRLDPRGQRLGLELTLS